MDPTGLEVLRAEFEAPEPSPMQASPDWSAPPAAAAPGDDETLVTTESQQGLRVLEYSAPAKSRHRGAVLSN